MSDKSSVSSALPPGISIQALRKTRLPITLPKSRKTGAPNEGRIWCANLRAIAIRMLAVAGRAMVEKKVLIVTGESLKLKYNLGAIRHQVVATSARATPLAPHRTPKAMKRINVVLWSTLRPRYVFERPRDIKTWPPHSTGALMKDPRLKIIRISTQPSHFLPKTTRVISAE